MEYNKRFVFCMLGKSIDYSHLLYEQTEAWMQGRGTLNGAVDIILTLLYQPVELAQLHVHNVTTEIIFLEQCFISYKAHSTDIVQNVEYNNGTYQYVQYYTMVQNGQTPPICVSVTDFACLIDFCSLVKTTASLYSIIQYILTYCIYIHVPLDDPTISVPLSRDSYTIQSMGA